MDLMTLTTFIMNTARYFNIKFLLLMLLVLVECGTRGQNFCDVGSLNPNNILEEIFNRPTDILQCTATNEYSDIAKLYRCVDGTGIPVTDCNIVHSTVIGRVRTNCNVTIGADSGNETQIFYCVEAMLGDPIGQLTAHWSVSVLLSAAVTTATDSSTTVFEPINPSQTFTEENTTSSKRNGARTKNQQGLLLILTMILITMLSTGFITGGGGRDGDHR